jgi:hypothetical protein
MGNYRGYNSNFSSANEVMQLAHKANELIVLVAKTSI